VATTNFDLQKVFAAISAQMGSRFVLVRELISHPGEKGAAIEDVVKDFWRAYLPERIGITSGFVVGATGQMSRQMDIIFYDADVTPLFFSSESLSVVPVECTIACCEVKATINNRSTLEQCVDNMLSYKHIRRTAYKTRRSSPIINTKWLFGTEHEHWQSIYFVFAIESAAGDVLKNWYNELNAACSLPIAERIDSIFVLNRGCLCHARVIQNSDVDQMDMLPNPNLKPIFVSSQDLLVLFYILAFQYLSEGSATNFNVASYITEIPAQFVVPIGS
jgi:hypothetical protein